MKKQEILELLREMPDEIDAEDLFYRLYVRRKIADGEAAIEAGDVLSHEEMKRRIEQWLK